jgi:peptidoglycan/LPS O-acetylase OafA/YrhL
VFKRIPPQLVRLAGVLGAAALGYLILKVANVPFKYLGAETVVACSSFWIIVCLIDERCGDAGRKLLGWGPLVWLGQRSYAVYLWHWPLAEWTNELPTAIGVPLGIGCSLLAAELSWRLVEYPAQKFAQRRRPAVGTTSAVASVRLRAGSLAGSTDR